MNFLDLMLELDRLDVRIDVRADRLFLDAPKGSLTPQVRAALGQHRDSLMRLFGEKNEVSTRVSSDEGGQGVQGVQTPSSGSDRAEKCTPIPESTPITGYKTGYTPVPQLLELAADLTPSLRFTLRETNDVVHDVAVLVRCRQLIEQHQPGFNRVVLTIHTLDGRRVTAQWLAIASPELRRGIAAILRSEAVRRKEREPRA
jgi:hypothetical protein